MKSVININLLRVIPQVTLGEVQLFMGKIVSHKFSKKTIDLLCQRLSRGH